jgi:dTDP-4-amino-4,6-dideoxygalactose transaminase
MNVPLLDLRPQYETLRSELLAAIEQVIDSQQFVLGPAVTEFEKEIGGYLRVKQAIGCGSGSDALLLALMACDVKAGDEIITTPFTFFATGGAIARMSARPVFVDIDPRTYTLNPALVEGAISSRTRAILPVHLYGQCADMDRLAEIAARHDLPIIEDAAQAIGAEHRGQRAGSMGIIGCFSFYPSKNLGAAGDAGLLTTNDDEIANRLRKLRVHGGAKEYHHLEVGINSRLDSLQAAILRVKLRHLDSWSDARRQKAARYDELFADAKLEFELTPPLVRADGRHIFHQYVVRVPNHRDELMAYLDRHGIGTRVYYPIPLHLQECFKYLGYREGDFPHSEAATRETMALPCYPEMSDEQQEYVVETIGAFNPNQ